MHAQISHDSINGRGYLRKTAPRSSFPCLSQLGRIPGLTLRVDALSPAVQKKCEEWLALDREPGTIHQAKQAIDAGNESFLEGCLGQRLAFGQ